MKLLNRKGQGTTEYLVIIAVVIVALMLFWSQIKTAIGTRVGLTVAAIQNQNTN